MPYAQFRKNDLLEIIESWIQQIVSLIILLGFVDKIKNESVLNCFWPDPKNISFRGFGYLWIKLTGLHKIGTFQVVFLI